MSYVDLWIEIQGCKFPVSKPQIKFLVALFVFLGRFSR